MKYNEILVDFNFLVDLDLAMFKFIKTEYNNPKFVDQKILSLQDEKEIIQKYNIQKSLFLPREKAFSWKGR